jgi:hypothetical protein
MHHLAWLACLLSKLQDRQTFHNFNTVRQYLHGLDTLLRKEARMPAFVRPLKRLLCMALVLVACQVANPKAAVAEERVTLGWGRMFSNDLIGDGGDRWRTGSYTVSRVRGTTWRGLDGLRFGDLIEFRAHAAAITPASLTAPPPGDRRYAGVLSLGAVSHFDWKGAEVALGAELAAIGPQTGVGRFQKWFHETAGFPVPSGAVLNSQIGNHLYPGVLLEAGRSFALGDLGQARPFVEARGGGLESLVRVGADVTLGRFGQGDLMLRDVTTGQRYRAVAGDRVEGMSLTLGGDMARVFDSALFPAGGAAVALDNRYRMRAGVHWQGEHASAFYGVSYLSREFQTQPEGQIVGALSLSLRF